MKRIQLTGVQWRAL